MSEINHHISDHLIAAYAAGSLPKPFSLVVAAHVSMCDECRARLESHEAAGGVVLEELEPVDVSRSVKDSLFAQLDAPIKITEKPCERSGIYPAPVMQALKGKPLKWRRMGGGVRQMILDAGPPGSVRLLYIPPNRAMPDHSHGGLELTMVLQGSFHDDAGSFGVGDVEIADQHVEHTPISGSDQPCICLAATDAPLRFRALIPRVAQRFFRI